MKAYYKHKWIRNFAHTSLVVLFTLSTAFAHTSLSKRAAEHRRYKIPFASLSAAQVQSMTEWLVRNEFDIAGVNQDKKEVEVITDDAGIKRLEAKGIRGRVEVGTQAQMAPDKRFLNPDTVVAKMKQIQQAYPKFARLQQIGATNQGRPVMALLISSNPAEIDPTKPSVIIDGMHHAREIMTPEIVIDMAETILSSAFRQRNSQAQAMIEQLQIWLVPMVNPDGNNIVWTDDNMWRKNARAERGDIFGVDVNRNYPFAWARCNGSSASRSSDTYRGASAGSEPETQSIVKLAELVRPVGNISYHSYSELVLFPYGCKNDKAAEIDFMRALGTEMAQKLPRDGGGGFYKPGRPPEILYGVDGASIDYFYGRFGAISYCFEVNTEFQPKYELRDPTVKKHRAAWSLFFNRVMSNLLTVQVIDQKTQKPAQDAEIQISGIERRGEEPQFHTNSAGYFFKVLAKNSYTVSARLADGRTAKAVVDVTGSAPVRAQLQVAANAAPSQRNAVRTSQRQ